MKGECRERESSRQADCRRCGRASATAAASAEHGRARGLRSSRADRSGTTAPGTRLREEHVVESFAISRNTVREAFRLLAHEGLVDHVAYRGVHVRRMGADDVLALYRTRRLVEPLGLRGDRRWRGPGCDAGSGRQRHRCRRAERLARRRHGGHRVRPGDLRRLPQCAHFGDVGDVPRRTAAGLPAVARPRATPPAVPGQKSRSPSLDRSSRRGCSLRPSWTTT